MQAFSDTITRTLKRGGSVTAAESMTANRPVRPSLIVSASGMATGGRVLHHLRHLLPDRRNTVLIVHGEASAAAALRDRLDHELGWTAAVPALGERATITARKLRHRPFRA